jgi:hypothetical protein
VVEGAVKEAEAQGDEITRKPGVMYKYYGEQEVTLVGLSAISNELNRRCDMPHTSHIACVVLDMLPTYPCYLDSRLHLTARCICYLPLLTWTLVFT